MNADIHKSRPDPGMAALAVALSGMIGFLFGSGLISVLWWWFGCR